jgi:threonine/homoserine/homoserine lactone efflux protein
MSYLEFSLIMLAAQFSPGPDMLLLLKAAVNHPLRTGLMTVCGIVSGLAIHCALGALGLSVLLQTNPWTFKFLLAVGAAYLAWLASKLLRSHPAPDHLETLALGNRPSSLAISSRTAFLQGFITNITNVKAFLFLTSFLTAGLSHDTSATRRWMLVGIILGQALVLWSLFLWVLKRPPLLAAYQRLERPLNLLFGILLLCLAAQMLLALAK